MPAKKVKREKKFELGTKEEMIDSFQNDVTRPYPEEMYTQEDQTLYDDVSNMKKGGMAMCRGGGAAIRGTKFEGVK